MDCRTFRAQHCALVDDTLSGVERDRMRAHLAACAACAALDARVRRALIVAWSAPAIAPSPGFAERLAARLAAERARARAHVVAPRPAWHGAAGWIAAATVAVAAVVAAVGGRDEAPVHVALPPVLAAAPVISPDPVAAPAIVAATAAVLPLWPALVMVDAATAARVRPAVFERR